jgi:hypothetical protein
MQKGKQIIQILKQNKMEILIKLTKDRAHYLLQELKMWGDDASIIEETENWATIQVNFEREDPENADDLIAVAFNTGVSYGRKHPKD